MKHNKALKLAIKQLKKKSHQYWGYGLRDEPRATAMRYKLQKYEDAIRILEGLLRE